MVLKNLFINFVHSTHHSLSHYWTMSLFVPWMKASPFRSTWPCFLGLFRCDLQALMTTLPHLLFISCFCFASCMSHSIGNKRILEFKLFSNVSSTFFSYDPKSDHISVIFLSCGSCFSLNFLIILEMRGRLNILLDHHYLTLLFFRTSTVCSVFSTSFVLPLCLETWYSVDDSCPIVFTSSGLLAFNPIQSRMICTSYYCNYTLITWAYSISKLSNSS